MTRHAFLKTALLSFAAAVTVAAPAGCDNAKDAKNAKKQSSASTAGDAASGERGIVDCEIEVTPRLQELGVKNGAVAKERQSKGKGIRLSVYLVFEKKFEGTIRIQALTPNDREVGRTLLEDHSADPGEAGWHDFDLDERIDDFWSGCKIRLDLVKP